MWIYLYIGYLFVYLFKLTSIETGGTDHLFLFTYVNNLLWHILFVLIFSIYLFTYSKQRQDIHMETNTLIYLLI